jgi:hypothetical protein
VSYHCIGLRRWRATGAGGELVRPSMKDCRNDRLLVKRLGGPLLGFVLLLGSFALGRPESAFAQAGSTGGVISKQDKSISGVDDNTGSQHAVPARKLLRSTVSRRTEEKAHDTSSGCGRIVGAWQWPFGQKITFSSGGLTQSSRGDTGKWMCERSIVVASWKSGNIDRITLSPDGTQVSVTNNVVGRFSGIHRIGTSQ